jgi:hypothetical protein
MLLPTSPQSTREVRLCSDYLHFAPNIRCTQDIKACLDMSIRRFFEFLEVAQHRLYFDPIGYGTAL